MGGLVISFGKNFERFNAANRVKRAEEIKRRTDGPGLFPGEIKAGFSVLLIGGRRGSILLA